MFSSTLLDLKKMWTYLNKLSLERGNLSRDNDVIQELFKSKQKSQTLAQFYAESNKLFEEVKKIFPLRADVKEMPER